MQSCNPTKCSVGDACGDKRMRRTCEVDTPTCPEFSDKFVSSVEKKMMEADVQGHCLIMSVAVNKRMLWSKRREIINNSRQ